jgi:hypothetical protein
VDVKGTKPHAQPRALDTRPKIPLGQVTDETSIWIG